MKRGDKRTTYTDTYIDKQIHTVRKTWYEEKQRKGNQRKERERTWKRRKYSSRYPNKGIQSLERINNNRNFILLILTFFTIIKVLFIYKSFRTTNYKIFNSTLRIPINPLCSRLFSFSWIHTISRTVNFLANLKWFHTRINV